MFIHPLSRWEGDREIMLGTLIVEDNPFNQDTLKQLFSRHFTPASVEVSSDGKEAIRKVGCFKPDLILMDIRLPDVSGLELTKKIKHLNPEVKIIVLTGHHYPEYEHAAARYGADGFLVKGGSSRELLAMVESFFPELKNLSNQNK